MELGIFERQLKLMVLLTQNRSYTVDELAAKLNMSRRTVYRYIELFREIGFVVMKQDECYRLDKESSFFREITQLIHFTEDEALTLRYVLDTLSETDVRARQLRRKLERIYDFGILNAIETNREQADNLQNLYEAMKLHKQVILHDYSSANSNTTDNRLVEPYMFLQNHNEVRCYELRSKQNKTFKVSRIGRVEMLNLSWAHETEHMSIFTDLFEFSGEKRHPIKLRLGRLATNLLKEEYPRAASYLVSEDEDHWLLSIEVCSFQGVGRFVLGLSEDIEVLESEDFRRFLAEKIHILTKKFSS